MANDNYLVIPLNQDQDILYYQIKMLLYNPQPGILPVQTRVNNQEISLHYNLGLRLAISELFQHERISGERVLRLLLQIIDILQDSRNLLLNPASFMLELHSLYINPHTWEVALIYLPLHPKLDLQQSLINFIDQVQYTQPPDSKEIQQISEYLQRDFVNLFKLKDFITQIWLQGSFPSDNKKQKPFKLSLLNKQLAEKGEKGNYDLSENKERKGSFFHNINFKWQGIFLFSSAQIIIAVIIFQYSNFLNSLGNPMVTYLGLALLLGGINVLVLRKIFVTVLCKEE